MSRTGLFITFEGIDGAGKSSHIEGLAAAFRAQGRAVTVSREPGGTPLAESSGRWSSTIRWTRSRNPC